MIQRIMILYTVFISRGVPLRAALTVAVLMAAFCVASGGEIDVRKTQLFLDDEIIESVTLLERVLHQPIRHSENPLLSPEEPWEGSTMNYLGGVYRDEATGLFRAWYVGVVSGGVPGMPKIHYPICIVLSDDGIRWRRPKLNHYAHLTGGPNNIVLHLEGCASAPTILHDKNDPDRPWKLIIHHSPAGVTPCHYYVRLATSTDGINWKWEATAKTGVYAKMHDRLTAKLDPTNREFPYVLFGRPALSRDYPLLYPGRIWTREVFQTRLSADAGRISEDPVPVLRPDLEDPTDTEFYHLHAFAYESLHIGVLMTYRVSDPPRAEVQLVTSRDLRSWQRVRPRRAFIPSLLPEGRDHGIWDAAGVQPALSPPILHKGALWFYYYGGPEFHGSRFLHGDYRLGVARLRPDGFASLRANWREGTLTTRSFKWPGGKLVINCETRGVPTESGLRVAVLNEAGHAFPEYSRKYSDPIERDSVAVTPTWSDKPQDLDSLIGKKIRLRFFMRQADLYSFKALK